MAHPDRRSFDADADAMPMPKPMRSRAKPAASPIVASPIVANPTVAKPTVAKPTAAKPTAAGGSRLRWLGFGALLLTATTATAAVVLTDLPGRILSAKSGLAFGDEQGGSDAPVFLARSTLMALNDANRTGNYGVLRALAAPGFQSANSGEALARIFEGLRREGVDLSIAAVRPPSWAVPSVIGTDGLLRLRGAYSTGRHAVRFALAYAPVGDDWRLIEISVAAEPAP